MVLKMMLKIVCLKLKNRTISLTSIYLPTILMIVVHILIVMTLRILWLRLSWLLESFLVKVVAKKGSFELSTSIWMTIYQIAGVGGGYVFLQLVFVEIYLECNWNRCLIGYSA